MVRVHFYLDSKIHFEKNQAVIVRFYYKGKPITIYLDLLQVKAENWNKDSQRADEAKWKQAIKFNRFLNSIKAQVEDIYLDALADKLTASELKERCRLAVNELLGKEEKREEDVADLIEATKLFIERNPRGSKQETLKKYGTLKSMLIDLHKATNQSMAFERIDQRFFKKANQWLWDKQYLNNTINIFYRRLRDVMTYAKEEGWHRNSEYMNLRYKEDKHDDVIFLHKDEVQVLIDLNLSMEGKIAQSIFEKNRKHNATRKINKLNNTRDIFVFACMTGQRFQDYKNLKWEDLEEIDGKLNWKLYQQKQNKAKVRFVPINGQAIQILERQDKDNINIFNIGSEQKYRDALKDLFEIAKLDRMVKLTRYSGKKRIDISEPLHKLISAHKSRSTFITLMKLQGVPNHIIRSITGHSNDRAMEPYEGIDEGFKRNAVDEIL